MPSTTSHEWAFRSKFRRGALGWRASGTAVERVRAARAEIRGIARKAPCVAAEGVVVFLERAAPAFENIDSSSGALGSEVRAAVDELVTLFHDAPLPEPKRQALLERIWEAYLDDGISYIESIGDRWGMLCATKEIASSWADKIGDIVRLERQNESERFGYVKPEMAGMSALFRAGRHRELMDIVNAHGRKFWPYLQWGFRVLVEQGKPDEAIRYAEASDDDGSNRPEIARACEDLLRSLDRIGEAYERFALDALDYRPTYRALYLELARKYPEVSPKRLLHDLVARSPGKEGKWFAAAMAAGLPDEALELAQRSPTDPKTLTRAAVKYVEKDPRFAVRACIAALRWIVAGYGHELTQIDVLQAFETGRAAAQRIDGLDDYLENAKTVCAADQKFAWKVLKHYLEP